MGRPVAGSAISTSCIRKTRSMQVHATRALSTATLFAILCSERAKVFATPDVGGPMSSHQLTSGTWDPTAFPCQVVGQSVAGFAQEEQHSCLVYSPAGQRPVGIHATRSIINAWYNYRKTRSAVHLWCIVLYISAMHR